MSVINYSWDLDNSVNRLFNDLIKKRDDRRTGIWSPAMDIHETEKEFTVSAELPGLKKDQINIDIHNNVLTISGEVKKDEKYNEGNTHIQERHYGSFTRGITIPPNVKADDVTARFENGLLELKLPKSAPTGKKITVQ